MSRKIGLRALTLALVVSGIFCVPVMGGASSSTIVEKIQGINTLISAGTDYTDQYNPSISGDYIVWEDNQNGNPDIYIYSITTGIVQLVANNNYEQTMPSISGNTIVWVDNRNGDADIYLYNITLKKETRVTTNASDQIAPVIDGDRIIWMDQRNGNVQIYRYNITTGQETPVTSDPWFHGAPSIHGDQIVWVDFRNGESGSDIYLYDIGTANETRITNVTGQYRSPGIDGDYVVWEDDSGSFPVIRLYNIKTRNETFITTGIPDSSPSNPKINRARIVWQESWNGVPGNIFLYDINTSQLYEVTNETFSNEIPEISGNRIVWVATPTLHSDIHMFTIGASGTCPVANFTENITIGSSPLRVSFTDTSSGISAHNTWDFGDGNISREQNPVHVYATNGTYTVSLTVDNAACRNQVTKQNLISVGGIPIPQFTANPTGGPSPLSVQFTDASYGSPDFWSWNFGDNITSEEQSPVHIFVAPGIYNVSLTAGNIFGNNTMMSPGFITVTSGTVNEVLFALPGLTVTTNETGQLITCNTSQANCSFDPGNNTVLRVAGPSGSTIADMILFSEEGTGFGRESNDIIQGNLTSLNIQSIAFHPEEFSDETGKDCSVSFSLNLTYYPESGKITSVLWEGVTPADYQKLLDVVDPNPNFAGITDVAYTARFDKENIGPTGPATIVMSVNSTWVREHSQQYVIPTDFDTDPTGALISIDGVPRGSTPLTIPLATGSHLVGLYMAGYEYKQATINVTSDSMRVIRIGDDGVSSILNTTLLWSDPEAGLDYYQASSPDGLSTFAIAGLNRHGNPFQLFTLFWTSHVSTGGGGGGGGGYTSSSGSGGGGGSTENASTVTPTQTPVTTATEISAALTTPENRSGTSNFASTINPDEPHATEALAAPPTTVAVQPPVPSFGKTPFGIISGMIIWIGELTRGRYIFIFAAVAITVVSVIAIWKRGYIGQD